MRSRGASEAADVTAAAVAAVRPSAAVAAAAPPAPHKQEKWCAILCLRIFAVGVISPSNLTPLASAWSCRAEAAGADLYREAMVPTPPPSPPSPPSPGTGVPRFKPMGKVKLLIRLGGLRMHNNPNNNSHQKDFMAAGQLAPAWQTMRSAVQKQMMAAALGEKSRAAKDNFNMRRQPMLKPTSRSLPLYVRATRASHLRAVHY
jgi:hypothetical protein